MRDGIIVLDKCAGVTSQGAVSRARKLTGIKKIGHTGTLDKFATGVLPLMVGNCTRLARFVVEGKKRYLAEFRFGKETDTLDPEGAVTREAQCPARESIESCLDAFRGRISQVPPEYSAISIQGRRAYEIVRSGGTPEMESREINVYSLELLEYGDGLGRFSIECSKGTYVRSLARDIGRACGSAAYVQTLRRVLTGGFSLEETIPLENVGPMSVRAFDRDIALKVGMGIAILRGERLDDFLNGKKLGTEYFSRIEGQGCHAVFEEEGALRGVVSGMDARPSYEVVIGRNP